MDYIEESKKILLVSTKKIHNNESNTSIKATNIANRLCIEKSIMYVYVIEVLKIIIHILKDNYDTNFVTYSELKNILSLLMKNDENRFMEKVNIEEETKKLVNQYYNMQEETQTEVMKEILFGLRKVRNEEKIF